MTQSIPKIQIDQANRDPYKRNTQVLSEEEIEGYVAFNISSDFNFSKFTIPSSIPSQVPSSSPTVLSTSTPSLVSSSEPSIVASSSPSVVASMEPTVVSSSAPTIFSSGKPSLASSPKPSIFSSMKPTVVASAAPSVTTSSTPTVVASAQPTLVASSEPTLVASLLPTVVASTEPTFVSSSKPSTLSSVAPSFVFSSFPTILASTDPTIASSASPSILSSSEPTVIASSIPSVKANSCGDIENIDPPPQQLTVAFDYEVVVDASVTNTTAVVETLEAAFLRDLSSMILDCDIDGRRALSSFRRSLQLENTTEIVGIESDPTDKPDPIGLCAQAGDIGSDEGCIPIIGGMTYYSTCESCPAEKNFILSTIQSGCEDDLYVDGTNIKKVHFVGVRLGSRAIENPDNIASATGAPGVVSSTSLVFILVAGVVAVIAAVQLYRKKRREDDDASADGESFSDSASAESA